MKGIKEETELLTAIPNKILMIEILAKNMDIKTLGKLACVSKWWNKTLHSQEFIDTRYRHHPQSTRLLFADSYGGRTFRNERLSFSTTLVFDRNIETSFLRTVSKFKDGRVHGRRVSSVCRDLVYAESDMYPIHIIVCNPWTGQLVELPYIRTVYENSVETDHGVFGYLASARKYVVVKLTVEIPGFPWKIVARKIFFNHVNHSPSKKLKWETMNDVCPFRVRGGIFVDCFVFWLINDTNTKLKHLRFVRGKNQLIVSLDVEKEKFGIINCPQTPYWKSHPNLNSLSITLIDLNGTLGLTDQETMSRSTPIFELWALKHESRQWEMKYTIRLYYVGMHLACHKSSMDGEMILQSRKPGTWYIYNPKTNRTIIINMPPLPRGKTLDHESVAFFSEIWPPTILY